jgi:hypothetical protein
MKTVFALLLLLSTTMSAYPCSIFRYTIDGRTYFCGNEDWIATDPALQTFTPRGRDYGCVLFGWKSYLPRYVQAGINSRGLCFDWAAVPPQEYSRDSAKPEVTLDFTVDILKRCASVDEAIEYMKDRSMPHLAEEHIMLADRTGRSCVVEYNHSKLRLIYDDSESQFITNFHITDRSLGWYPCGRYSRMEAFFKEPGSKETRLADLLDAVHQEGSYPTVYSYVFDLSRMEITVFHHHDFRTRKTWSIKSLLSNPVALDLSF